MKCRSYLTYLSPFYEIGVPNSPVKKQKPGIDTRAKMLYFSPKLGVLLMSTPVTERIAADIAANPVILYMKGTPDFPMCGFSAAVVQVLKSMNVPFKGVNVLEDDEIRQGIKEFSNWPT